ncbi:hypothetical protein JW960_10090 [candidate division KSB1 bacterium]|nr:hypothetical protein [candidate division KSB1 bacterium]
MNLRISDFARKELENAIYYYDLIEEDGIVISAVAHQYRKPDYWIDKK